MNLVHLVEETPTRRLRPLELHDFLSVKSGQSQSGVFFYPVVEAELLISVAAVTLTVTWSSSAVVKGRRFLVLIPSLQKTDWLAGLKVFVFLFVFFIKHLFCLH